MKILWVKAGKLLPVDTGGKIRSHGILRQLANHHELVVLSYYGGPRDREYEASIRREFSGAEIIYTRALDATVLHQSLNYLRSFFNPAPFAVSKFTHPVVRERLRVWLCEKRFDIAICDFLSASLNFPDQMRTPAILFQHNVESSLWRRMAYVERNPIKRAAYRVESAKMSRYEKAALRRFQHIIAVSQADREQIQGMEPSARISVVPTGVDVRKFPVAPPSAAAPARIVFTGSMDWEPNIDAVGYFCDQVWPRIRTEFPDAVFQVVGRNPHPKVQKLASNSVEVTGTVPSVTEYLREATVVAVPLRIGGGTRLKIFEAMAMGKAVVSTSIGAEGLDVENRRDLILADTADGFVDAILELLRDPAKRRGYEEAAVRVASQYDWSRVAERFVEVLRLVIEAQPTRSEPHPVLSAQP